MSNEAKNIQESEEQAPALNVLIIAHKQSQLASAAAFLSRRGVPCTVKGNIKDGIHFITSQKATLVFLSWNLPNANIIKTYQLLTQNFKVNCVVFAEKPDGKTAAELTGSRLPEVMQAPVSGPGLYMRIQKILKAKDEQNKVDKVIGKSEHNNQSGNDKIVLKSSKSGEEDDGGAFYNLGSNKNQSDKPGIINFQSGPKYSEGDYEAESHDPNANDISAYMDQLQDALPEDSHIQEGIKLGEYDGDTQEHPNLGHNGLYNKNGQKTSAHGAITQENPESDPHSANSDGIHSDEKKSRSKKDGGYGSVVNVAKKNQTKEAELAQYEVSKPKEALIVDFKPRSGSKNAESILAQKTFEAIERSVRPAFEDYAAVDKVSKAKIFNIHTPRFRGYLIFVVPMFNEFDRNVVASIRENLESLLKEQSEFLLYFEELNIDLEQTEFLSWAEKNAEFFVQTVDHKSELICAYYPYDPSLPTVKDHGNKMATVNIKDLKQNTKTNFNLYIHLPKNNKYVCYMKPGDIITEKHRDKFEKHQMNNLHIKNEEVTRFKEYFVSNQIQDIIKKKAS